nr:MAG TPA: repressor domain protein [Caudoviricetes sp.]
MDTEMKVENWDGYDIRFVEHNGEWWAVLADICKPLGLRAKWVNQRLDDKVVLNHPIPDITGRLHNTLLINEFGIYDTIFASRKPEAKEFRHWVFSVIKYLREQTGLEGFEVFRMMDKEHQKQAMTRLHDGLSQPMTVDYIKANMIANKAVSNKYGYPKLVKKDNMTPQMMRDREPIVDEAVNLMITKERYGLDFSVSDAIYNRLQNDTNNGGLN